MKRKIFSVFFAVVLVLSFSLVTAVPVAASPGSYSTDMGRVGSGSLFNITDSEGLNWGPLKVEVTYADGKAAFVITAPAAFNLEASTWGMNDNFALVFDADNDGTADFQVLYNTGEQEDPEQYPDMPLGFHWATKACNGSWSSYQPIPGDWNVSEAGDLSKFTASIPVSYLGGPGSNYKFVLRVVKYVSETEWPNEYFDPICGGWSTLAFIDTQFPVDGVGNWVSSAGYQLETVPRPAAVWVDDGYTFESCGGHIWGWDAFATIEDGIDNVAEGGTVNVAAGDYDEQVTITKGLTLLGANAGKHPAVGTHPTETVEARGDETILSRTGTQVVRPYADDITIDGFKLLSPYQVIYTYEDANRFHLTNCIFGNRTPTGETVILFGSGSHTDMLFDFNLFQDPGARNLYFGGLAAGIYDRLHIAYNEFNGMGEGVFWAGAPLVGGIVEGNEFDGTIGDVLGVGGPGLNIGKGGNIIIRDNWFHDMASTGFQVGIVGGSVTGNIFEGIDSDALQLWGGQWGTAVSTDVLIEDNIITFNDVSTESPTHGIRLRPGNEEVNEFPLTLGVDASNIHINNNDFIDGGQSLDAFAIRHQGEPGTVVDAENNWWGDASGPCHTTNPDGQGGAVSDGVDFSPWFGNEAGTTIVELVTSTNPDPVTLEEDGSIIAIVDISGGDAQSGTIAAYSEPGDPAGLFVGTGTTGVVFLDVKVTGYTEGWAHITVPYPDVEEPLGTVDDTDPPIFEHTLALYYWDEALPDPMWCLAFNSQVNTEDNFVSGYIPVSALTGTPIGLGGYEALVAIDSILNLSDKSNPDSPKLDTVKLTINTSTAVLGSAEIDLIFDPRVVEVLGVVGTGKGEDFVATSAFENLRVRTDVGFIDGFQIARFLAYQTSEAGVDAATGVVVAEVILKAVGSTMDFSPLHLDVITLKDNEGDRIPVTLGAPSIAIVGGVGDANRDTYVDSMDLVTIEWAILEIQSKDRLTMNVDGKDDVDAADCTYLARHLAGVSGYPLPPDGWVPPWGP